MQARSRAVYEFALLLSQATGLPVTVVNANLELLFGELVSRHKNLFTTLVTTNKRVLQNLLRLEPDQASAALHANNMSYRGFESLKRTMLEPLNMHIFPSESRIKTFDLASLEFVTRENFELTKLYHTAKSTAPTDRLAIRVWDFVDYVT